MMTVNDTRGEVPMTVTADEFKNVMSTVAATVTVVTARGEEAPIGLTVSAFMSVSADPPIVLVCVDKSTASLDGMLAAEGFTVNIMPESAGDEAMLFATHGADKFGESQWSDAAVPHAGPVLASATGHLECEAVDRHEVGDHWVIYGQVEAVATAEAAEAPLVWHNRSFARLR